MKFVNFANRAIEFLFYSLFLLVPLVFAGNTSELFEFNKMWITFGIATAIGFFWITKMILLKDFRIKRTPLDIPIVLFLASQLVSTIISLDRHISLWGYYSRFNGGLLSWITYVFLYYAFVSNIDVFKETKEFAKTQTRAILFVIATLVFAATPFLVGSVSKNGTTMEGSILLILGILSAGTLFILSALSGNLLERILKISLFSGFMVALWSIPSHFGYDPTCLIFRGQFDVLCWTNDFQPKVRIFGPMGQPDWLAGYMAILLPISLSFGIREVSKLKEKISLPAVFYFFLFSLFYVSLLWTGSRSGVAGSLLSLVFFVLAYAFTNKQSLGLLRNKVIVGFVAAALLLSFLAGIPEPGISKFSLSELQKHLPQKTAQTQTANPTPAANSGLELGGTNSFKIRQIVWRGALDAWKNNPLFGTGTETFAFAYYKYRPAEHNLVSEWNFLYNKAHNEYLNYLATTGAFGLVTYLSVIGLFLALIFTNYTKFNRFNFLSAKNKIDKDDPLILGLVASFLSILIINFFGFSVVIMNIYLILIPAFIVSYWGFVQIKDEEKVKNADYFQWIGISLLAISTLFVIYTLAKFWVADTKYALGFNYNRAGEYQTAYPLLQDAIKLRSEPIFEDEVALNDAILAVGLASQGATDSAQIAQNLAQESLAKGDKLTKDYPSNIVFWKSRVRVLYTLSKIDPRYLPLSLDAMKKTAELAPTDAGLQYNLGVLYGQNGNSAKAVEVLENTVRLKPDYIEARYALALFYHDVAQNSKASDATALREKAIAQVKYILEKLDPANQQAKDSLDAWQKER